MKALNYLRTFNAGDWIALSVWVAGLVFTGCGLVSNLWAVAVGSLQPEILKIETVDEDLFAQRSMAAAAWWMVALTGLSLVVGAFTLYLIFRTLQEAKRSADAAHGAVEATMLIGKRQVRAYLDIENATATVDRQQFIFSVDASLGNSGQSPARSVNGTAVLRFVEFYSLPEGDMGTDILAELSTSFTTSAVSAGKKVDMFLTFGLFFLKPPLSEIFDGFAQRAVKVDIRFEYTDVFDDTSTTQRMLGSFITTLDKINEGIPLRVSSNEQ